MSLRNAMRTALISELAFSVFVWHNADKFYILSHVALLDLADETKDGRYSARREHPGDGRHDVLADCRSPDWRRPGHGERSCLQVLFKLAGIVSYY